jgi:hypothetical protein
MCQKETGSPICGKVFELSRFEKVQKYLYIVDSVGFVGSVEERFLLSIMVSAYLFMVRLLHLADEIFDRGRRYS